MVFFVDSQEDLVLVSILLIRARRCSIVFIIDFEQLFAYRVIFALFDSVDQFRANFPFLYPLKTTKKRLVENSGCMVFSWRIEMEYWPEIG